MNIHSFFYKNKVYKNIEPQIGEKVKNILDAEIVITWQLFLIPHMEAENTFSAGKSYHFWCILEKYQDKNSKICEKFWDCLEKLRIQNFEAGFAEKIKNM